MPTFPSKQMLIRSCRWIPVSKRDLSTFSKQVGDKFVNDLICHASI
jgi:hypothetical protein